MEEIAESVKQIINLWGKFRKRASDFFETIVISY